MIKYTIEFKRPNETEWKPLRGWARPFTDGTTLDETLDEGCINLSCVTRSKPIPPFSKIRIRIFEKNKDGTEEQVGEINRVVGTSKRTQRTFSGKILWDWTIQTLEETKLLEREACSSMTSTHYVGHDYAAGSGVIQPTYNEIASSLIPEYGDKKVYYAPQLIGASLSIHSTREVFTVKQFQGAKIKVYEPDNTLIYEGGNSDTTTIDLTSEGIYRVVYNFYLVDDDNAGTATFYIGVVPESMKQKDPTITSVCERLLSAGITRRQGVEEQKYTLDPAFAEKYKDVPAPEFSFTRQTLFEALLTVGGYIHAIPRLNGNVVTFDELGGDDEIDMTNFPKQVYCDKTITINDFTSTLDSPAQNLLNTQDRVGGAITELGNDYITVRTEDSEVIISADTAIIRTSLPINQIVKLECGFIDGRSEPVGDITAYVYEAAEYDVLSSYWGTGYPYSKGFALKYVQGDNKITGLQTKIEYPNSTNTAFSNPAIINIILMKTGIVIPSADIRKLAFKVTYVPIVTSRVTQRKPYGNRDGANNGAGWDNTLFYNQGGNVVESSFYGDKMKGAIARLGNEVEQRTYDFYHYSQLPKCGQKLDGMYIARVDAEYDITRIRATLTLTKDFNMLSQYVGLNSNYRLYDISEKQSVERFINYSENIYVGDDMETPEISKAPMIFNLYEAIKNTLDKTGGIRVQLAKIDGKDRDGNAIGKPVVLPVLAFGFGNSLAFTCSMYDNYGAGFQNSNGYLSGDEYKGVQRLVPYGDALGEMETMSVEMFTSGWNPTAANQEPGGNANLYPAYVDGSIEGLSKIWTVGNPLIIKKDSREQLGFAYQAHFVANRETIVLGPSITYSNALVAEPKSTKFNVYFFDHELNMLDKVIDLTNAENAGAGYSVSRASILTWKAKLDLTVTPYKPCKSWAIVEVIDDTATQGTLFIGENIELETNQFANPIIFTGYSNIGKDAA